MTDSASAGHWDALSITHRWIRIQAIPAVAVRPVDPAGPVGAVATVAIEFSADRFRRAHDRQPSAWAPWAFEITTDLTIEDARKICQSNEKPTHSRWLQGRPLSAWYGCSVEVGSPLVIRFRRSTYKDARKACASLLRFALSVPGARRVRVINVEVLPFK
jgi:hypothetical protein